MVKLMICPNCKANIEDGKKFCPICGFNLAGASTPPIQDKPINQPEATPQYFTQPPVQPMSNPQYQQSGYSQGGYQKMPPSAYVQPNYQPTSNGYSNNAPLSVGDYIITFIILGIPVVGFIMLLVWACSSSTNLNKKNFAIAVLILQIIGVILTIIIMVAMGALFASIFSSLSSASWS